MSAGKRKTPVADNWKTQAKAAQYDALKAENAKLRDALKECADDLEASVNAEYRDTLNYPSQKRKYDRDMGPVLRARSLLE